MDFWTVIYWLVGLFAVAAVPALVASWRYMKAGKNDAEK